MNDLILFPMLATENDKADPGDATPPPPDQPPTP